jgi:general secretion pathway protein L
MTTLIVTLPMEPPLATAQFDYVLTPEGRTVTGHSRVPVALLPAAPNGEVVAVVPVQALSWHAVQLPRGTLSKNFSKNFLSESSSPRLRAILDGLLEERLLDDPAQLHFALAPGARDDAPVWVAVCDRAWLRSALQSLEQAGRPVSRIVPEFAPPGAVGPASNGAGAEGDDVSGAGSDAALHVIGTPESAHIVFVSTRGVTALPLSHASVALAAWPDASAIVAEPAVAALAEGFFKRPAALQQSAQRRLRAAQSDWDLAQFDLVNSGRTRTWKRAAGLWKSLWQAPRWRAARWALGALAVVNLLGLNAWAWKERSSLDAKRLAVRDVLTRTFPGVKVVVDAPVQMARELAVLRQATGGASKGDFESILTSFGALALVGITPSAIEYVANEVRFKNPGLGSAQVAEAAGKLKPLGYAVRADGDSLLVKPEASP